MKIVTIIITSMLSISSMNAYSLELTSNDITPDKIFATKHEYNGFGCTGENVSPMLAWKDAPVDTKFFAISVFDPDAPTGSGWWHWQVINIPREVSNLEQDAGNVTQNKLPEGAIQMRNDYGIYGYGGACPPIGHGKHRYQFTIYALPNRLDVPSDASGALVGFMLRANAIASNTIEVLYGRDK